MSYEILAELADGQAEAPPLPEWDSTDLAATIQAAERYALASGECLYAVRIIDANGIILHSLARYVLGGWVRLPFVVTASGAAT